MKTISAIWTSRLPGTQRGVTGIQLDLKNHGISETIVRETLEQARDARLEILRAMLRAIKRPREEISANAPRLIQIQINPEKIGLIIGPGGKTIRRLQEETGAKIDIDDTGVVTLSSVDAAGAEAARDKIVAMTEGVQLGRIYEGRVTSIKDFGAFVEILPGKDGLVHISELSEGYVSSVSDVCRVGDPMLVKAIAIDDQDRVKLSRKAAMAERGQVDEIASRPRPPASGGEGRSRPAGGRSAAAQAFGGRWRTGPGPRRRPRSRWLRRRRSRSWGWLRGGPRPAPAVSASQVRRANSVPPGANRRVEKPIHAGRQRESMIRHPASRLMVNPSTSAVSKSPVENRREPHARGEDGNESSEPKGPSGGGNQSCGGV